jgi:hypothetical protein
MTWERRDLKSGRFHLFGEIWQVRVMEDPLNISRPFTVLDGSSWVSSFKTLREAKCDVLRRLIEKQTYTQ